MKLLKILLISLVAMHLVSCGEKKEERIPTIPNSPEAPVTKSPSEDSSGSDEKEGSLEMDISSTPSYDLDLEPTNNPDIADNPGTSSEEPSKDIDVETIKGSIEILPIVFEQSGSTTSVTKKEEAKAVQGLPVPIEEELLGFLLHIEESQKKLDVLREKEAKLHLRASAVLEGIDMNEGNTLNMARGLWGFGGFKNIPFPNFGAGNQSYVLESKEGNMFAPIQKMLGNKKPKLRNIDRLDLEITSLLSGRFMLLEGRYEGEGLTHILIGQWNVSLPGVEEPIRIRVMKVLTMGDMLPASIEVSHKGDSLGSSLEGELEFSLKNEKYNLEMSSLATLLKAFDASSVVLKNSQGEEGNYPISYGLELPLWQEEFSMRKGDGLEIYLH